MSSFPIVPRAGGPDRATPRAVALPSLNLGKISFAAMGGSAEILHFPENDVAYDVDSSDEDLDGMEAAVEAFEARRVRARAIAMARARTADADERLARETAETETALEAMRARRARFEAALAARAGARSATRRIGKAQGQIDVEDARSTAFAEAAALEALRQRRARIDARIAALLGERRPERRPDDAARAERKARAAAAVDAEYVEPRWKQRRDRRRAEALARERRVRRGENETGAATGCGDAATSRAVSALDAAARLTRAGDVDGLRALLSDDRGAIVRERIDADVFGAPSEDEPPNASENEETRAGFAGYTLLTLACARGEWPAAKCLLGFGADINALDRFRRAPVDAAVHEGHFAVADALVRWAEKRGVRMGEP